ncbi:MAG TPA: hypothetical protein VF588_22680 [Pyrinomonadaceae bacterium]
MSWLGLLAVAVALTAFAFIYACPRLRKPPVIERDFVGTVLDKSLTLRESQTGTTPKLRLLVRARDGRQFEVAVTPEQYERARVGMWVTRVRGAIGLSWEEPGPSHAGEGGGKVEGR